MLLLDHLTGDPGQEFLTGGLTRDMILELGRRQPAGMTEAGRASVIRCNNPLSRSPRSRPRRA